MECVFLGGYPSWGWWKGKPQSKPPKQLESRHGFSHQGTPSQGFLNGPLGFLFNQTHPHVLCPVTPKLGAPSDQRQAQARGGESRLLPSRSANAQAWAGPHAWMRSVGWIENQAKGSQTGAGPPCPFCPKWSEPMSQQDLCGACYTFSGLVPRFCPKWRKPMR